MGSLKILSQKQVSMAELKEELSRIKERDGELNFRGTRTEEYLEGCVQQKAKDAQKLAKKIMELEIPRLREEQVLKIVDILPKSVEELKVVIAPYMVTISQENLKKIVDAITEELK